MKLLDFIFQQEYWVWVMVPRFECVLRGWHGTNSFDHNILVTLSRGCSARRGEIGGMKKRAIEAV